MYRKPLSFIYKKVYKLVVQLNCYNFNFSLKLCDRICKIYQINMKKMMGIWSRISTTKPVRITSITKTQRICWAGEFCISGPWVCGSETLWWLRFEQWVNVYLWFSNATSFKTWVLLITFCKLEEFYPLPHVFIYQYIINLTNTVKVSPFYNPLV